MARLVANSHEQKTRQTKRETFKYFLEATFTGSFVFIVVTFVKVNISNNARLHSILARTPDSCPSTDHICFGRNSTDDMTYYHCYWKHFLMASWLKNTLPLSRRDARKKEDPTKMMEDKKQQGITNMRIISNISLEFRASSLTNAHNCPNITQNA